MSEELREAMILPLMMAIFGIIFTWVGVSTLIKLGKQKKTYTSKTVGKVIDLKRYTNIKRDGRQSASWYPVVEYSAEGATYTCEHTSGTSQARYAIGQEVEICYDPADAEKYYIAEDNVPKTVSAVFTAVGIVIVAAAAVIAVLTFTNGNI